MIKPPSGSSGVLIAVIALLLIVACTGSIGTTSRREARDGSDKAAGQGGVGETPTDTLSCTAPRVPKTPFRKLTPGEIDRSLSDLVGNDKPFAQQTLPPHDAQNGFANDATRTTVTASYVDKLMRTAEAWAEQAALNPSKVLPCTGAAALPESSCVEAGITRFIRRAFRRPPQADEVRDFAATFKAGQVAGGFAEGVRSLVGAVVLSPSFVLEVETGASRSGGLLTLTDHELATRLAYRLTGAPPDEVLSAEADAGRLHDPQQISIQAERLAATARGRDVLRAFMSGWLDLAKVAETSKDTKKFPEFSSALAAALHEEALQLVDDVLWGEGSDGQLHTLLTTNKTRVDGRHAPIYGASIVAPGAKLQPLTLPSNQRAGLLTLPGVLAAHAYLTQTSPIHRGLFVQQRLLCVTPPAPPATAAITEPPATEGTTSRQRFEAHRSDPACAGCHRLLDPLGFAFEHYDAIGRYREAEAGQPISALAELDGPYENLNGSFDGAIALTTRLASSDEVLACAALQAFRFGAGRSEAAEDECSVSQMQARFAAAKGDLRQLLLTFTQTPAFFYRVADDANTECKP